MLSAPLATPAGKKYCCYNPHWSKDSVSPLCLHFLKKNIRLLKKIKKNCMVLLSASVERFSVSCILDFFIV